MNGVALAKLTPEFLAGLVVGAPFETEGVFPGVTPEPVLWTMKSGAGGQYLFDLSYLGVRLGDIAVFVRDGKVEAEAL